MLDRKIRARGVRAASFTLGTSTASPDIAASRRFRPGRARPFRYAALPAAILAAGLAGPLTASPASAAQVSAPASAIPRITTTPRAADFCGSPSGCGPAAIPASWQLYTPPGSYWFTDRTGTITIQGTGFPPGDSIEVELYTAGGIVLQEATASEPGHFCNELYCGFIPGGTFTVTAPDIACGPVSSAAGGGSQGDAAIEAVDSDNGQYHAGTAVPTPCPNLGVLF
jgi:hypothetical protein